MFSLNLSTEQLLLYLVRLMIIFLINPLHECAHALAAHKLGDDTAKNSGRLTLDPLAHIDPFGALFLLLLGFGWAKPVPVSPSHFKKPRRDMMLTAVAGPASNLAAAFLGVIALQLIGGFSTFVHVDEGWCGVDGSSEGYLVWMLYAFATVNLDLCLFNLLPVPPLDGSRVLTYLLPPKAAMWFMRNSRVFYGIVFFLMITGIVGIPIFYGEWALMRGMAWLVSWMPAVVTVG